MNTETGFLRRIQPPLRRIALLRASRVGDFLCATPAFRALKKALPDAQITLIAMGFNRPLAERCPYLDDFEEFPGWPGMAEQFFDPCRATAFLHRMQQRRFDLAIQMHGSGAYSNPFALLLGARQTAGFRRASESTSPLDASLPFPDGRHEIQKLLDLVGFLGVPAQGENIEIGLRPADLDEARRFLDGLPKPWIGIMPEARDEAKRWPARNFAEVSSRLTKRWGGTLLLLGDGGGPVLDLPGAVRLAGRQTLVELAATIHHLALLITNDSAPAHMAYAQGTPSVTVFLATSPGEWGPLAAGSHRSAAGAQATVDGVLHLAEEAFCCRIPA